MTQLADVRNDASEQSQLTPFLMLFSPDSSLLRSATLLNIA